MGEGLKNLNVVFFESRHAKTFGDLIALNGGVPVSAPALKEVPLENNPDAFRYADRLFKGEIDVILLLTGVGTRFLLQVLETRHPREEILEAWKKCILVPRGPKPIRVLKELGVPFAVTVPEPNTWHEILKTLDENKKTIPIAGRVVAVQEYGVTNQELIDGLKLRGADVVRVPIYRWALPDDTGPLREGIRKIVGGQIQVAMFTTAVQIEHVLEVAREMGVEEKLKEAFGRIAVASVGPDTSQALRARGIEADIQPESSKMGPFVAETAERAKEILRRKI